MTYEIKASEGPEYLRVEISGVLDEGVSEAMVEEFVELFSASPHYRVLIDTTALRLKSSTLLDYSQASYLVSQLMGKKHRIANVSLEIDAESNRFFETVGVNRGLIYRAFTEERDAIDWLDDERPT